DHAHLTSGEFCANGGDANESRQPPQLPPELAGGCLLRGRFVPLAPLQCAGEEVGGKCCHCDTDEKPSPYDPEKMQVVIMEAVEISDLVGLESPRCIVGGTESSRLKRRRPARNRKREGVKQYRECWRIDIVPPMPVGHGI